MLARFSGNEFAALLPGYSSVEARDTAHRLQETVAMEGIENNASHELSVLTASVGFHTLAASEETSLYTLVDGASRHLRKSRGRA